MSLKIPVICHDPSGITPNTFASKPIIQFKELEPDQVRYNCYRASLQKQNRKIVKKYDIL